MNGCIAVAEQNGLDFGEHEPEMYNDTDAIGFALVCLNDNEKNIANVCRHCGCLYPAEIWREK